MHKWNDAKERKLSETYVHKWRQSRLVFFALKNIFNPKKKGNKTQNIDRSIDNFLFSCHWFHWLSLHHHSYPYRFGIINRDISMMFITRKGSYMNLSHRFFPCLCFNEHIEWMNIHVWKYVCLYTEENVGQLITSRSDDWVYVHTCIDSCLVGFILSLSRSRLNIFFEKRIDEVSDLMWLLMRTIARTSTILYNDYDVCRMNEV